MIRALDTVVFGFRLYSHTHTGFCFRCLKTIKSVERTMDSTCSARAKRTVGITPGRRWAHSGQTNTAQVKNETTRVPGSIREPRRRITTTATMKETHLILYHILPEKKKNLNILRMTLQYIDTNEVSIFKENSYFQDKVDNCWPKSTSWIQSESRCCRFILSFINPSLYPSSNTTFLSKYFHVCSKTARLLKYQISPSVCP